MSIDFKYQVRAEKRLEHIKSHVEGGFDIDRMVDFISTRTGDPRACASGLSSHALASAMLAWFEGHDLELMKNWYYVSAELNRFAYGLEIDTISPLAKKLQLLKPLLSDNSEIIDWFSTKNEASFNVKKIEARNTLDYFAYQVLLAIRGEWVRLAERCESILESPPANLKFYVPDFEFYLALAMADKERMQKAILDIVSPKRMTGRSSSEGGYTEGLISSYAVIYAKIAWRHGHEIVVDTPYVPMEWLPVKPLSCYESHYDFLK